MHAILNKRVLGIPLAIIILVGGCLMPPIEGLSPEGVKALAVLLAAVALWMCETLPLGITGMLALVVMPIVGAATLSEVFVGFGTSTFVFAIAVFGLTAIVMKSDIAVRLIGFLVKFAGSSSKKLVLMFMAAGAVLSAVMNDSATVVLFLGFCDIILEHAGGPKPNLKKCLYIGCSFAIFMGGMATPAGASINVLALGLIEELTGATVPFLDWIICVAPVSVIMVPVIWFCLIHIFKPEDIDVTAIDALRKQAASLGKFTPSEIKTLALLVGIPALWIIGSWVPALDVTTVSVIGLALMSMPGMKLLTFEEFQQAVPWSVVIMIGSVISLGGVVNSTGGIAFLADLFLGSGVMGLGMFLTFWIILLVIYFCHSFVPVGPGLATIAIPPLMSYCVAAGYSPAIPAILLACILSGNLLLPHNPALALSYKDNAYTFMEPAKAGIIPVLILNTLLALWVPFMVQLLGLPKVI